MPLANITLVQKSTGFDDLEGNLDAEPIAAEPVKGFLQAASEFAGTRGAPMRRTSAAKSLQQRKVEYKAANPQVMDWVIQHDQGIDGHFASNLMTYFIRNGFLSIGQVEAVKKILAEDAARAAAQMAAVARTEPNGSDLDLTSIPEGFYAVPDGETRLKVKIDRPTPPSKWSGFIFVSDGAEYGQQKKYGRQSPGKLYTGDIKDALRAILADPKAASAAYGKLVGRCGVCNRKLEDAESVERGIGPICAGKLGW